MARGPRDRHSSAYEKTLSDQNRATFDKLQDPRQRKIKKSRHHCNRCGKIPDTRCFREGHVARCDICEHIFNAFHGCSTRGHSYTEGVNLEAKARYHEISVEELRKRYSVADPTDAIFNDLNVLQGAANDVQAAPEEVQDDYESLVGDFFDMAEHELIMAVEEAAKARGKGKRRVRRASSMF